VQQGGVIRRKARDIKRFAGMELFMREIHRRGYQVAENSGQIVIFCNRAPVRWLTHGHPYPISSKEIGTPDRPRHPDGNVAQGTADLRE